MLMFHLGRVLIGNGRKSGKAYLAPFDLLDTFSLYAFE
jgi:hypothetical protein